MEDLATFDAEFFTNHRDVAFGAKSKQIEQEIENLQNQSDHDEYSEEQLDMQEANNSSNSNPIQEEKPKLQEKVYVNVCTKTVSNPKVAQYLGIEVESPK